MNLAKLALAAIVFAASPAFAADVTAGAKVTGPEGNEVGTIVSVEGTTAVLDTGKHQVPLALDSFGDGANGPTITVSKVQLDTMVDNQLAEMAAARDSALVQGAAVATLDNQALGTIDAIDGDNIVIVRAGDATKKVTLLRDHFDAGDKGPVARLTLAQIDAAVSAGQ